MTETSALHIAGRRIAADSPPYVIAELSANHHGSLESALRLIDIAKAAGADAIKLQTYRPDTITLDAPGNDFRIQEGPWRGQTLYELYSKAQTPWEWHLPLFERARQLGLAAFSSPFDPTAVDLLEGLGTPAYKIASFEVVDLPLIEYAASTGKPIIISTGMADADDIADAIAAARRGGCREIALLSCVSAYPAPPSDYNLRTMVDMGRRFGLAVGLSDHTIGPVTAVAAVALGACVVEKHLTLSRDGGGADDAFSAEPEELTALCRDVRTTWEALGSVQYGRKTSERSNVQFRRSLYFVRSLDAGALVTAADVRSVRPGYGLAPRHLPQVVGRRTARRVEAYTPVTFDSLT